MLEAGKNIYHTMTQEQREKYKEYKKKSINKSIEKKAKWEKVIQIKMQC